MGGKNKLKRFRENETFSNVVQPKRQEVLERKIPKGSWADFFGNTKPLVLELGCGKGEYTLALAEKNPHINYVGIDIKGARFWKGAKTALQKNRLNVAFLRVQIELIDFCFGREEISEIWITFPDPQIKFKRTKHRLTNPTFLEKYRNVLKPNGLVHLKTDSAFLYGYTLGVLMAQKFPILYTHHDIYNNPQAPKVATNTQTFYEKQYLEKNLPITYLKFGLWKV